VDSSNDLRPIQKRFSPEAEAVELQNTIALFEYALARDLGRPCTQQTFIGETVS